MQKSKLSFALIAVLCLAQPLYSQTIDGQVSTSTTSLGKKVLNTVTPDRISHFSIVNGPSLDISANPNEFDGAENPDGISSWHQVSFQYRLTEQTSLVINPRFILEYNSPNETTGASEVNGVLDNPVFGINSTWLSIGNFSWSGSLNTVLWVFDEDDRKDGLLFNPGGFQTMNYKVSNSLSVGTWLWARYRYFADNDERDKLPMFVSPYISYDFNDNLGMITFYQVNGVIPSAKRITWDPDDHLNFLLSWKINDAITLQPIVTLFRETDFALDKGNLNLWVSGRLF